MPAVRPLPPTAIRLLLEKHGYELIGQDRYNWAFASRPDDPPVIVPYTVDLVPLEVAFHIARKVGFTAYFDVLSKQPSHPFSAEPLP